MTRTPQQERKARQEEQAAAEELDTAKRKTITTEPTPARQRIATDYVHTVNPDGLDVVFIPGEALPEWVQDDAIPARTD